MPVTVSLSPFASVRNSKMLSALQKTSIENFVPGSGALSSLSTTILVTVMLIGVGGTSSFVMVQLAV